jgi:hypothetical protein
MIESTKRPACAIAKAIEPAITQRFTAPPRASDRSAPCPILP